VACSLGKGLEDQFEQTLIRAASSGDWIILENIHLVQEWLPLLEETF
jgi:dynein heavy chain